MLCTIGGLNSWPARVRGAGWRGTVALKWTAVHEERQHFRGACDRREVEDVNAGNSGGKGGLEADEGW